MRKNKMIAKACPKCHQQVPVACKSCPCGHSFFTCKKTSRGVSPSYDLLKLFVVHQRKREKPEFYDSLNYDKQLKRNKAAVEPSIEQPPPPSSSSNEEDADDVKKENAAKRRIGRKEDTYEEIVSKLSEEKKLQCKFILNELNRKIELVSWKPYL